MSELLSQPGGFPLLSAMLWTPVLGLLALLNLGAERVRAVKTTGIVTSLGTLVLAVIVAWRCDGGAALQLVENRAWAPEIGMGYALGVDGLSLPMVLLTVIISTAAMFTAISSAPHSRRGHLAWLLLLEFALLGVFLSTDWFLFYMFWELSLIPMFFLIGIWGGPLRLRASLTFFLYTLAGSIPMLMALLAAHVATPSHTFAMAEMARAARDWTPQFQLAVFVGLLAGLLVKVPAVPLHGWLPLAHVEAPVSASMMLSAVMLKMGGYGLMRAGFMTPHGLALCSRFLVVAGVVSILYGAVLAWRQTDVKAMVAWSSVSHMGFVLIGVSAVSFEGYTGAAVQMFAHGLTSALLFFCVGALHHRAHARDLEGLAGAARSARGMSFLVVIALLANLGLPGLAGFVGELHAMVGALETHGLVVLAAGAGVVITALWSLRALGALLAPDRGQPAHGLSSVELLAAVPLALLLVVLGLRPSLLITPMSATLQRMLEAAR